jgi:HAD superfamily hydrolase (TIGR01484 family)
MSRIAQKMDLSANHYNAELAHLANTYEFAISADLAGLKAAIAGASESSLIGVGSGGSFTVASLLCNLHEAYTGRVSRPSTPLEIICNPTLAASSPVFLISAEGKNPDIIEALQRSRLHSARAIHVVTNRADCPLMEQALELTDIASHIFELTEKDGYLATNSLLLDAVVLARSYGELDRSKDQFPPKLSDLRIGDQTFEDWVAGAKPFTINSASRGAITILYSPLLKPIATDLESKLSEAALLHVQLADLRSFAHGRHLWLAQRPNDCAILALTEPSVRALWDRMSSLIPTSIPQLNMSFSGARPRDLIAGLTAQMYLTAMIADCLQLDPGRPTVPQFGRDLYYLPSIVPAPVDEADAIDRSKYDVLGSRWPSIATNSAMQRARRAFIESIERQRFRAVVFDYDGTLCSSRRRDVAPPQPVLERLIKLANHGIIIGIASGRGGSIQERLSEVLSNEILSKVHLGLYNGGWIGDATSIPEKSKDTSEFLSHVMRIVVRLQALGVPIEEPKVTHPYQVSVRFREGLSTESMWFVVADALRQAGLDLSRMVRSKHSVDILAEGVNKSRLVAHIIQYLKINPYEILTIGDQGAWPGNDSELLEHRFSLSVDLPSRRLDRGWKLAPPHKRDVDATVWYLDRFIETGPGLFQLRVSSEKSGAVQDA